MLTALILTAVAMGSSGRDDGLCLGWSPLQAIGQVTHPYLDEISGMAVSRRLHDVIWVHNDSGGEPALYAVATDGELLGTWYLLGATNRDWEDISVGPCPGSGPPCTCLHLADTGDNTLTRQTGVVWRVPEPDVAGPGYSQLLPMDAIWFRYPDGPRNTEAIMVHPDTGEVVLVTKEDPARIYGFPDVPPLAAPEHAPVTLRLMGSIDMRREHGADDSHVTAADVSPAGLRVVLRTDLDLLILDIGEGASLSSMMTGGGTLLAAAAGGNEEAVAFSPDGQRLYLVAEEPYPTIFRVDCENYASALDDSTDPLADCEASPPGDGCGGNGDGVAAGALALVGLTNLRRRSRRRAAHNSEGPLGGH